MCGAEGFVDSSRQQHSYRVRHQAKVSAAKTRDSQEGGIVDRSKVFTVVDLAAIKSRDQKEHDKKIRLIEVKCCKCTVTCSSCSFDKV